MPIGGLAVDRPGRRRRRLGAALGPQRHQLRRGHRRQLLAVRQPGAGGGRPADRRVLVADPRARRPAGRRVLLAGAVRHRRHDADGAGHRPAAGLPGARDDVDRRLRADRAAPRPGQRHRGGVQVLPARRLRQLVLPLRHRLHLRRDRHHPPRAGRRGDCRPVDVGQPDAAAGRRPADRRLRLQGGGGAVPHVVARRLRGRAGGGHRLHVHRREGRGGCRLRAACSCRR